MIEGQFELTATATGEVRDANGNLVEVVPVEGTTVITADQARALGLIEGEPE